MPCGKEFWASLLPHLPLHARARGHRCSPPHVTRDCRRQHHIVARPVLTSPYIASKPAKCDHAVQLSLCGRFSPVHESQCRPRTGSEGHDWRGIQYDVPCPAGGRHCVGVGMPQRCLIPHGEGWRTEIVQESSQSRKAISLRCVLLHLQPGLQQGDAGQLHELGIDGVRHLRYSVIGILQLTKV